MKKIMGLVLLGLLIVAGSAQAHCGKCGMGDTPQVKTQGMDDKSFNKMSKELKLSAAQKEQFRAIMEEKHQKKQAIMEQKQAAMSALHEEVRAKLKTVLSAEQMKVWEAKKASCPMCKDGKPCKQCALKMKEGNKGYIKDYHGQQH